MKRVVQEDPTGCGIACIAMLASTKYQTVKEIAFDVLNLGNDDVFYTTASDLRKLGAVFNLEIGGRRRKFKSMNSLPDLAILAINYRESKRTWHWVVYCRYNDEQFILDPKKSIKSVKRTDFGRLSKKSRWFIEVKR